MIDEIICGDCLDVMRGMEDNSVDLVLTDIPYNEVNRESSGLRVLDKRIADSSVIDLGATLKELNRVCKGSIYIFCGIEQGSFIRATFVSYGLSTRLCIWEKTNPSPMNGQYIWLSGIECCVYGKKTNATFNESCKNSVWHFPNGTSKIHPTQKPLQLFEYLVVVSSNVGDIILDPFLGSGTTAVACVNLNRHYIGIELSEEYCSIARQRVEDAKMVKYSQPDLL